MTSEGMAAWFAAGATVAAPAWIAGLTPRNLLTAPDAALALLFCGLFGGLCAVPFLARIGLAGRADHVCNPALPLCLGAVCTTLLVGSSWALLRPGVSALGCLIGVGLAQMGWSIAPGEVALRVTRPA